MSSLTHIQSFLVNVPASTTAKLPKGETECRYAGDQLVAKKTFAILTTDVSVLTGAARATFDATWAQYRGSPLVVTVDGVGDDAAWVAPQDTLVGIAGNIAFVVTLEPSPVTIFTPTSARTTAIALARIVVSHL